jgi:hypothetical protein
MLRPRVGDTELMSVYQVQKLLFNLHNDLELKERYRENPHEVLKRYDLADSERKALLEPDVGSLYRMGTHTYLLWAYGNLMGVSREAYFEQIGSGSSNPHYSWAGTGEEQASPRAGNRSVP